MADISKLKVTQNGASTEYNVKDTAARNAVAQVTQDLANYYLKSETYNKSEVDNLIAGIKQFTYVVADSLPTASASTMYKIYLIPSAHSVTSNVRDEYITVQNGSTYTWEEIGSTTADFSDYSTTEEMNAAIASALTSYYTKTDVDALLASLASDVQDDIDELAQDVSDSYAKKDGDYETLGAGSATNLKGNTVSNAKFAFRTAGGSADIATGQAQLSVVRGNTVVWNQRFSGRLLQETTFDESTQTYLIDGTNYSNKINSLIRPIVGHKYYGRIDARSATDELSSLIYVLGGIGTNTYSISVKEVPTTWTRYSRIVTAAETTSYTAVTYYYPYSKAKLYCKNILYIDLTLMFGAGNEPATTEEFEAMFPEEYYQYSESTLLSFRADGIKTVGFNQFNLATGKAKVIPNNEYQITGTYTSLSMNGETITPDSDGIFTPTQLGDVDVAGGNATTCIHLVWSGIRNGEFEEYWESRLDYPLTQLTGKLNGEGESVVIFPDGLRSAGTVHDEIVGNRAIKRIGSVNIGTLSWGIQTTYQAFYSKALITGTNEKRAGERNIICSKYPLCAEGTNATSMADKTIVGKYNDCTIYIKDSSYTVAADFKAAMSGVILYYELATPQEYILDDFQLPAGYRVDDFGTEEIYVSEGITTPCDLDVVYGINAADTIRRLPDNYVSATEAQTFTESEKAQARKNIDAATPSGVYKDMVVGGSLNLVDASDDSVPREFTFDTAGGVNDIGTGLAVLKRLKGNTIVWNQRIQQSQNLGGLTVTFADGVYTFNGTANTNWTGNTLAFDGGGIPANRKVYFKLQFLSGTITASNISIVRFWDGFTFGFNIPANFTPVLQTGISTSTYKRTGLGFSCSVGDVFTNVKIRAIAIDLTLMFGAGNEPSTAAEFEKLFPLGYYNYNAGSLLSFNGTGLKTTGFNQWDEEWEYGCINLTNGVVTHYSGGTPTSINHRIMCKNPIPVFPNTTYYIYSATNAIYIVEYDANGKYVSGVNETRNNKTFTTQPNTRFIRFMNYNINATYRNDICINLSWSGTKDGTYEPYEEHTLNYDISAIQDGEGNQLFPLGLLSAGNVHDELTAHKAIKRIGVVDMGTLTWTYSTTYTCFYISDQSLPSGFRQVTTVGAIQSKYSQIAAGGQDPREMANKTFQARNQFIDKYLVVVDSSYTDAAAFKAAMSGVTLYYELATPIEVDFDEQLNLSYNVNDWGTEELLPENGTTPTTSPAKFDIVYNVNAVDTLKNLSRNYLAEADLDRLLTALGTALGFTYTKTWNQETKEWAFTVTPTTQGE